MQPIGERQVFIGILVTISVATLFCLIGLATPGWFGLSLLINRGSTVGFGIISFVLLIACVVVAVIILTGIVKYVHLPIIFVSLLIVTSMTLLITFAPIAGVVGYSAKLIITAFAFTYLSSIAATYWLFLARGASENAGTPSKQQEKKYQYQDQDQQQQPPRLEMF